jgi:polysaccharide chain length determinant protein (PEP-CTERM system associated)
MQKSISSFQIDDYLFFLNRRKWYIIAPIFLLIVISIVVAFLSPRIYQSSATIQVDQPTIINPLVKGIAFTPEEAVPLSSLQVKLLSQTQIEKVIKTLQLDKGFENNPRRSEKLVSDIRLDLEVKPIGQNILQVSFQGRDPQTVFQVIDTLISNFIKNNMQAQQEDTNGALSFFQGQVNDFRVQMENAEAALRAYKEKHLIDLPGNINNNLQQLSTAQTNLLATNLELQQAKLRYESLKKQLAGHKEIVVSETTQEPNPLVMNLRQKIAELEIQLTTLRGQYTDKHPKIIEIRDEIIQTQKKLEQESEKTVSRQVSSINPIYQNLVQQIEEAQIKIETLTAAKRDLEQTVQRLQVSAGNIPLEEQELARLTRNATAYTNLYNLNLNKLAEAQASSKLEAQEKTVRYILLDPPRLPIKPIKPKPIKIIFLGCIMGMLIGLGTGLGMEYVDQTFTTVEELQRFTKIPVLGFISPIITEQELRRKKWKRAISISGIVILIIILIVLLIKYYPILKPMLGKLLD